MMSCSMSPGNSSYERDDDSMTEVNPESECILSESINYEFFRKTSITFVQINQIFQAREAMFLFALNFPSGDNSYENVGKCFTLKDIEVASGSYIAEIKEHIVEFQRSQFNGGNTRDLLNLGKISSALQLYHITFGMANPEFFTEAYLDWLNTFYISPGQEEANIIDFSNNPTEETIFGSYLMKSALRGLRKTALAIFSKMPESALLTAVKGLYQTMPRYSAATRDTFEQVWGDWKTSCLEAANEHLNSSPVSKNLVVLHDLLKIMSGRCKAGEGIFDLLGFYSESWQEMLGAVLLFHFPIMAPHRVGAIVECILNARFFKTCFCDKASEGYQISLLTCNLVGALDHSSKINSWLAAHLSDLVEKRSIVENIQIYSSTISLADVKEKFFVDYVTQYAFLKDPSSFQLGAIYLAECPTLGKDLLCKFLPEVPFNDLPARDRALTLCQDLFLTDPLDKICQAAVLLHVENNMLPLAIKYLLKMSKPPSSLLFQIETSAMSNFLAEKDTLEETDFQDFIAAVQSSSLPSLECIIQYFDFYSDLKDKNFDEASQRSKKILFSSKAPSFLLVILLIDILPLLEVNAGYFGLSDIRSLMKIYDRLDQEIFPMSPYQACIDIIHNSSSSMDGNFINHLTDKTLKIQISKSLQKAYYKLALSSK